MPKKKKPKKVTKKRAPKKKEIILAHPGAENPILPVKEPITVSWHFEKSQALPEKPWHKRIWDLFIGGF